jgi:hypothetical protein
VAVMGGGRSRDPNLGLAQEAWRPKPYPASTAHWMQENHSPLGPVDRRWWQHRPRG